jgi:hypothetical protein
MAEGDQIIRIVSVDPPTENTPALQAERDLVAVASQALKTKATMEKVADIHKTFRKVGGSR